LLEDSAFGFSDALFELPGRFIPKLTCECANG
jgi:hypothetical protein